MSVELLPPPVRAPELAAWNVPVPADWVVPSIGDVAVAQRERRVFVAAGSDVLKLLARPVDERLRENGDLDRIEAKMDIAAGVGKKRSLVGIAAPQVGESYRVIAVNLHPEERDSRLTKLYNPSITDRSRELYLDNESCFSCYKTSGRVPRHEWITVTADNLDQPLTLTDIPGNRFAITARIVQHELDHLDGIRLPDRIIGFVRARRLGMHALWWIHAEHGTSFVPRPRADFPPSGKSPSLHHAQMLRTHQTKHPWFDTMPFEQWEAIANGDIYIPLDEGALRTSACPAGFRM